jgi:hypothetical protein
VKLIYKLRDLLGVDNLGGTMRLGTYACALKPGSLSRELYGEDVIQERHRHRYEFNCLYEQALADNGMEVVGRSLDGKFVEQEMERVMVVGLWCGHPDPVLRPSIRQAVSVLRLEAPLPSLPAKMPVPAYMRPPMAGDSFDSLGNSSGISSGDASTTHSTRNKVE